jgi:hypothetical protein
MLVSCLISLSLWAQDQPKAASHIVTPGQTRRPAPLTPLPRKGLNMLQTAEAEAKALPAPARAYLLLEIASSYIAINSAKERSLRLQAFQATLAIEDDDATKEFLQWEILQDLLINSETDLEKALPDLRNIYTAELSAQMPGHIVTTEPGTDASSGN